MKLRPPLARQVESVSPAPSSSTSKSAFPPGASDFLSRHSVRRLYPLYPQLVEAKRQSGLSDRELALRVRQRFAKRAARRRAFDPPELTRTYVLELDPAAGGSLEDVLARLRSDPGVEYAEEDSVVRVSLTPNDPFYSSAGSWGQAYDDLYGLKKIRAGAAWDVTTGEGVTVAVVDTGLDYTHPDIADNVWVNVDEIPGNGVDDDANGFVDDVRGWDFIGTSYSTPTVDANPVDDHGHGTHVAGTVAAQGNNGLGVVGVAWRSKVMPVKGLDRYGYGLSSSLADAILYAANNGADVINNSWGGKGTSLTVRDALDYAYNLGVVSVCAAGNNNADVLDFFPASFPNVITVAATDASDWKAYYSNWGARVDVAAPGSDILSLRAAGTFMGQALDDYYTRADGTSMASPHVAGLAALVLSLHPTYSVEEIRQALRTSAVDRGLGGVDGDYGFGRVDAGAAVALAGVLEARIKSPADGARVTGLVALSGFARGNTFASYRLERGSGPFPSSWTLLNQSTSPVGGGTLGILDTSTLADGVYALRLTAYDASSRAFVDQVQLVVDYVKITSPTPPPLPNVASVFKPGVPVAIHGTATGPSFHSFRVEWARGLDPTDGWSAAGMSPVGGGSAPIVNSALATWNSASIVQAGYYTLRLVVDNTGFSSESRTVVYLEPDLLSANWPKWLPEAPGFDSGVVPATDAAGNFRLSVVVPSYLSGNVPPRIYTFSPDGASQSSRDLYYGAYPQPAAANVDGAPGEETIVAEANALRVLRSDGSSFVLSPGRTVNFQDALVQLEDLDGDGKLEVLAWGRDWTANTAYLFAWRPDGQQLNANFPIAVADNNSSIAYQPPRVLVGDLDGDGPREIFFVEGETSSSFTIRAYNGDGTPRASWPSPTFAGAPIGMALADLDKDGTPDLVFVAGATGDSIVHVLGADGSERPGWPFALNYYGASLALGDLDQDGRDEIVVSAGGRLHALRGDGSPLSSAWPRLSDIQYPNYHPFGPVAVSDVTGDGAPEILVAVEDLVGSPYPQPAGADAEPASSLDSAASVPAARERRLRRDGSVAESTVVDRPGAAAYPGLSWSDIRLLAIDAGAQDVRSWRLLGANGNQPYVDVKTTVGDFDRDGGLDIAVTYRNIKGGGISGTIGEGEVTVLKTGVPYAAGSSAWPSIFHDSRNTASLLRTDLLPPSVTITAPAEGALVTGPVTVAAQATDDAGVAGGSVRARRRRPGARGHLAALHRGMGCPTDRGGHAHALRRGPGHRRAPHHVSARRRYRGARRRTPHRLHHRPRSRVDPGGDRHRHGAGFRRPRGDDGRALGGRRAPRGRRRLPLLFRVGYHGGRSGFTHPGGPGLRRRAQPGHQRPRGRHRARVPGRLRCGLESSALPAGHERVRFRHPAERTRRPRAGAQRFEHHRRILHGRLFGHVPRRRVERPHPHHLRRRPASRPGPRGARRGDGVGLQRVLQVGSAQSLLRRQPDHEPRLDEVRYLQRGPSRREGLFRHLRHPPRQGGRGARAVRLDDGLRPLRFQQLWRPRRPSLPAGQPDPGGERGRALHRRARPGRLLRRSGFDGRERGQPDLSAGASATGRRARAPPRPTPTRRGEPIPRPSS